MCAASEATPITQEQTMQKNLPPLRTNDEYFFHLAEIVDDENGHHELEHGKVGKTWMRIHDRFFSFASNIENPCSHHNLCITFLSALEYCAKALGTKKHSSRKDPSNYENINSIEQLVSRMWNVNTNSKDAKKDKKLKENTKMEVLIKTANNIGRMPNALTTTFYSVSLFISLFYIILSFCYLHNILFVCLFVIIYKIQTFKTSSRLMRCLMLMECAKRREREALMMIPLILIKLKIKNLVIITISKVLWIMWRQLTPSLEI